MDIRAIIPDDMTVNDVVRIHPEAIEIFNDFGVEACCEGDIPVRAAAERDGADPEEVLRALAEVVVEDA